MTVLPTFPLSQIWGVDTGIHGDDLLYRFNAVAENVGLTSGVLPESQQRLSESINQAPYEQNTGETSVSINNSWVGDTNGAENRRLPDSNVSTNSDKTSSGFGANNGDTFKQLADLAVTQLPVGIKTYAQMVEPELRKLIPTETLATIEKGREIYEVAQQISKSWQDLSTLNQTLPFDKISTLLKIPGLQTATNFINSSIFGGNVKVTPANDKQISWYLNPTFSSAYQVAGTETTSGADTQ
jgi:hypothetical protein